MLLLFPISYLSVTLHFSFNTRRNGAPGFPRPAEGCIKNHFGHVLGQEFAREAEQNSVWFVCFSQLVRVKKINGVPVILKLPLGIVAP